MRYSFEGHSPSVHDEAFVSQEATLVGDVDVDRGASVWPGAVLRGDFEPVCLGPGSHVEENATVHASALGAEIMVGHGAVIDVSTVDDTVLVGSNATINAGSEIGSNSIVASGAAVPDETDVPPDSFVRGVPASVKPLSETSIDADAVFETYASDVYDEMAARHEALFK